MSNDTNFFYELSSMYAGGYWINVDYKHFKLKIGEKPRPFAIARWYDSGLDEATFGGNVDDKFFKTEQLAKDYAKSKGITLEELHTEAT